MKPRCTYCGASTRLSLEEMPGQPGVWQCMDAESCADRINEDASVLNVRVRRTTSQCLFDRRAAWWV